MASTPIVLRRATRWGQRVLVYEGAGRGREGGLHWMNKRMNKRNGNGDGNRWNETSKRMNEGMYLRYRYSIQRADGFAVDGFEAVFASGCRG